MTPLILAISLMVRGYLPLIRRDSCTHMPALTVYVKEGLPFAWLTLLHSVPYFFFLYRSSSSSLCMVFYSISSNMDEVFSINPSAVFVFGDLVNWSGELCYNFLSQMTLLRWLTFLLRFHTVILIVLLFWISIFLLRWVFVLQSLSLHLEILLSLHWLSIKFKRDASLYCIAYDYSCADWDGLHNHLGDVPWDDIFKLGASAAASEFCEYVHVGVDVYIPQKISGQASFISMLFICFCCCHSS